MPIAACKDCGKMVSTSAEVCPNCGAPNPTNSLVATIIVHRKSSFSGALASFDIFVDGKIVGNLWNDDSVTVNLQFGKHVIEAKPQGLLLKIGTNPRVDFIVTKVTTRQFELVAGAWGFRFEEF
jgi:RNA polymerase subunit RPABC4/transcription elongation factor Spt4